MNSSPLIKILTIKELSKKTYSTTMPPIFPDCSLHQTKLVLITSSNFVLNFMITPDYVLKSDTETKRLVILLHGYGASGEDLIEIGNFWAPSLPLTTFVAPNAPHICEINPMGYQWFGLSDFDPMNIRSNLEHAAPRLADFIVAQARAYDLTMNQVAIMGFSQGAMLALELMFHLPGLAGVLAYSGSFYRPSTIDFKGPYPPVLLVHGTADTVVPFIHMETSKKELKNLGVKVDAEQCIGLAHSIDVRGLQRGLNFLQASFTKSSSIIVMNSN